MAPYQIDFQMKWQNAMQTTTCRWMAFRRAFARRTAATQTEANALETVNYLILRMETSLYGKTARRFPFVESRS